MAKRTVPDSGLTDTTKKLVRRARRAEASTLPNGYRYVKIDGSLYIKDLSSGETTKVL